MFVGLKMCLVDVYKIPVAVSLGVIALALTIAIWYSMYKTKQAAGN